MDKQEVLNMKVGEVLHSNLDDTTYVVKLALGWAVCDNGEEVICQSADCVIRIVEENAA